MRLATLILLAALVAGAKPAKEPKGAGKEAGTFFDDFSYSSATELAERGWIVRSAAGLPGIKGAHWGEGTVAIVTDPYQPGNKFARLIAGSDGTPGGTQQAQLCHERKYFEGTYAARVLFSDAPVSGPDVDQMVMSFYTVSGYVKDMDPQYSELDFEYLPNGGWHQTKPTLFNTSWETFQMEPWLAFNKQDRRRAEPGWHTLVTQVSAGKVRYFLDGEKIAEHGGKSYPRVPMSINFNLWFIAAGWSQDKAPRVWQEDIDWVFHARNRALTPEQVEAEVATQRRSGISRVDTVPAADPPLPCLCNL
jgi:hypothetical protein